MHRGLRVRAAVFGLAAGSLVGACLTAGPAAGTTVTAPGAPTDLKATTSGATVTLTWDAPADPGSQPIQYYDLEMTQLSNQMTTSQQDDDVTAVPLTATFTGVTYNTYYDVTVAANNGAEGASTAPLQVIVYPGVVTKDVVDLTAPPRHNVGYRRVVVESTRVTKADTHLHPSGLTVDLLGRAAGGKFRVLGSVTTDSSGRAQITLHPTESLVVEWRFAGNKQYAASTSRTTPLSVGNIVKAKLSSTHVVAGHSVAVYGTVTPTSKGQKVGVYQLVSQGGVLSIGAYLAAATVKRQRMPSGKVEVGFLARVKTQSSDRGHVLMVVLGPQETIRLRGASKRLHLTVV